jgi:hypothetical protein
MHHTLSCEVHPSRIVQRILDSLGMVTGVIYLVTLTRVSFVPGFSSVAQLFSVAPILGV